MREIATVLYSILHRVLVVKPKLRIKRIENKNAKTKRVANTVKK